MKIGILTFHWSDNYGAVLQCYALQEYLKSHRRSILHSAKGDKRCRPLWQHGM